MSARPPPSRFAHDRRDAPPAWSAAEVLAWPESEQRRVLGPDFVAIVARIRALVEANSLK